ncbi:14951_t:CDS:2, partial [Cetraspora pellucida]
ATIAHIHDANAEGITGAVTFFSNVPLGLTAEGCPTNAVPVAPNAEGDVPIILAEIRFEQRLSPDIRDEIYRIGQTKPINNIIDKKPQQAFYIVDQEGNNMDPLSQDSDYLKYLEQAKALYKKLQRSNQSVRIDRIEEGLNEIQDTINQLADQLQKKVYIKKYEICKETDHSKGKCPNQSMVQSNYTQLYFTSLKPIYPQYILPNSDDSEEDEEGGHKNVPISIKYKNKWVTETEHVVIDNGKPNYLLFCRKSYIISTFTKPIKDNVLSSLYTTVIQDNNSKNQTFDSSTKIDTKEKPASNKEKEFQISDLFTKDLKKKHNRF